MALPASRLRSRRWLPRPGATTFSKPRPNASPSRIRATTRTVTTGRTGGMRTSRAGPAAGATARPGSGSRAPPCSNAASMDAALLKDDIRHALAGVDQAWPTELDTLCCGTLGNVEFLCEAGDVLGRPDIRAGRSRTARRRGAGRRFSRRLSLEQRQTALQSRAVPRARRRRLYAAAATRRHAPQRTDLGIAARRRPISSPSHRWREEPP